MEKSLILEGSNIVGEDYNVEVLRRKRRQGGH
jgi:hypothetical protein